jgi:5-methylcytosine-specific restriction endonuclease McrA
MKFELNPHHHNIPKKILLDDLKKTAARLGKKTITVADYKDIGAYHPTTLIRRFGGWNNVLKKAHLRISKLHNIPVELLFDNIEKLWVKLGRQPTRKDMYFPRTKYAEKTYTHRFGSWRKALESFVNYINEKKPIARNISEVRPRRRLACKHKTSRKINLRLRFLVMQRDNFRCVTCGAAPANDPGIVLHIDHIIPWDKGGETVFENLQTLCSVCNIGKSNHY